MAFFKIGKIRLNKLFCFSLFFLILSASSTSIAGNPDKAHYSEENENIFWFLLISDTHIGKFGDVDSENLISIVGERENGSDAYRIINPKYIINCGDLTNNLFTQNIRQWNEYSEIADINDVYSESPGNHDQYWEGESAALTNYIANSVQGRQTNSTQRSWLYTPDFGKYHFMTIATPHPQMTNLVIDGINACPGQISNDELTFIGNALEDNEDSNLTFIFGHHTLTGWGMIETGLDDFMATLNNYSVSLYGYGHTHADFLVPPYFVNSNPSLIFNVESLWQDSRYAIVAIDNDGVSVTPANVDQWPVVLITTPINKKLGGTNPYAYSVPKADSIHIRALIFDNDLVPKSDVEFRYSIAPLSNPPTWQTIAEDKIKSTKPLNGETGYSLLWEAEWDTSGLTPGDYVIEVEAKGVSDRITVEVKNCTTDTDCKDGNDCTDDVCYLANGQCEYTDNNISCNDGDLCTTNDTCLGGVCVPIEICDGQDNNCNGKTDEGCGDIDGDDCIGMDDVLCLYQWVIGNPDSCLENIDVPSCNSCDVDGNGSVDIMDVLCLHRRVLGNQSCLDSADVTTCN